MTASKPTPSELDLTGAEWQKSSYTGGAGNCVEMTVANGYILMRDSKNPDRPANVFTRAEIEAYFAGVKDGEFDHILVASFSGNVAKSQER
ncbi:DUF397 domain-containing protein [Streptomyces mobaraensis]|uniref:DUF397 domain-containing protein n=1 Tax=Streptomyces mobaraensis TaxID=35621 RepID=UPI001F04E713|nr:DUF397 domain-containing protein [Streptomyces mobaraensis]